MSSKETSTIMVKAKAATPRTDLRLPGSNCCAYIMLPFRFVFTLVMVVMNWSLMVPVAMLRAIYLRCCCGKPSKILKYGAKGVGDGNGKKNTNHMPDSVSATSRQAIDIVLAEM